MSIVENITEEKSVESFVTYKNFVHAIAISHPENWKITEYNDTAGTGYIVSFVPPGEDDILKYNTILWISGYSINRTTDISERTETSIKLFEQNNNVSNFTVLEKSAKEKEWDIYPSYDYTVSFVENGIPTKAKTTAFEYDSTEHSLVYWALTDRFEKYLPVVERMVESFRLIYLPGE